MIRSHQPTIFGTSVTTLVSSLQDGNMHQYIDDPGAAGNGKRLLIKQGINLGQVAYQLVTYDGDNYCRYKTVNKADIGEGFDKPFECDGLATSTPGIALFLPIADCVAAILYDPAHSALMISHLGRHSTEQYGAEKSVEFMNTQFGTDPSGLQVWLSPSPSGQTYPIWKRDNNSFRDVTMHDLMKAGIQRAHIEVCEVDTVTDFRYFSHSEFLKGNRQTDGRYAVIAMLN